MESKSCIRFGKVAGLFLLTLALFAVVCQAGEPIKSSYFTGATTDDPDLLLYVPFDGTTKATVAKGNMIPKKFNGQVALEAKFAEGRFGQSAVFEEDTLCYTHNQPNWIQGTIEMWVKLNFDPAEKVEKDRYHYLLNVKTPAAAGGSEEDPIIYCYVQQSAQWKSAQISFATRAKGNWNHSPSKDITNAWKKDEWHHVAISWDNDRKYLFVDDQKTGEASAGNPLIPSGDKLIIGGHSGRGYWGQEMMLNGCLDELLVWKKALKQ